MYEPLVAPIDAPFTAKDPSLLYYSAVHRRMNPKASRLGGRAWEDQVIDNLFRRSIEREPSTSRRASQISTASLGNNAGYYTSPSYGLKSGLVNITVQDQDPYVENTKDWFPSPSYNPVIFRSSGFIHPREISSGNTTRYYHSHKYGVDFDVVKPMRKATLKDFEDYHSIPSHELDVGPVKPTSLSFAQTQKTSLGYTAGYYPSPSYGLKVNLVKQAQKVISNNNWNYPTIQSYELDVGPVKPITHAFAWIQEIIFKNIREYPSIPSHKVDVGPVKPVTDPFAGIQETINNFWDYHPVPSDELNVGLLKPITNAFAWIEGGIDAIDNIVSLFPCRGYTQGSAIVGGKALVSEDPVLFFIDPNDTVLSKLLAAIDIGKDLFNKSIDNCFDVKTKSHGGLTPIFI